MSVCTDGLLMEYMLAMPGCVIRQHYGDAEMMVSCINALSLVLINLHSVGEAAWSWEILVVTLRIARPLDLLVPKTHRCVNAIEIFEVD